MIMVGPGTGVAPFRAFLQERRAVGAVGKNWLFFGEQRRSSDFLYEEEFILGERLESFGWKTAVTPDAQYFHHEGLTTSRIPNLKHLHFLRSEQYLLRNYYRWSFAWRLLFGIVRILELPLFAARNLTRPAKNISLTKFADLAPPSEGDC